MARRPLILFLIAMTCGIGGCGRPAVVPSFQATNTVTQVRRWGESSYSLALYFEYKGETEKQIVEIVEAIAGEPEAVRMSFQGQLTGRTSIELMGTIRNDGDLGRLNAFEKSLKFSPSWSLDAASSPLTIIEYKGLDGKDVKYLARLRSP